MRKVSLVLLGAVLGAGTATVGTQSHLLSGAARAAASDTYRSLNLFGDVFEKVRTDYVEKPDDQKLVEAAVNGMLTSLDPHSSYMDAKSFRDMQVQTRGEFGGLGIEVTQDDGFIKVMKTIDDTPASRAGILSGDVITTIDGEDVKGLSLNQAVDKMRGLVNTSVTLKITHGPKKEPTDFKLTRAVITIKSVESKVEGGDIGYIRIAQFNEQTFDGVKAAIEKFGKEVPNDRFRGYVLDLRNNPGGLLDQSIAVSNAFLDHGEIVSTRGRNADETQRYNARPGDISKGRPLVILINGGSASASEIVSGALQDHKRATVIGTRSFGKASVQTIIPLGQNNGAVRLTTARYYTPSGRSIQAKGIEPDIVVQEDVPAEFKGKDETKGEASLKGHLTNGTEEHGSSAYVPPDPKNDKQLIAAYNLLRGIKTSDSTPPAKPAAAPPQAPAAAVPAANDGAPKPVPPKEGDAKDAPADGKSPVEGKPPADGKAPAEGKSPAETMPATTVPPGTPAPAAPTTGGTPSTPPPSKIK